jgi:hypothetical protein
LLAAVVAAALLLRNTSLHAPNTAISAPEIEKQPAAISTRTFDPANPPPDLPPLAPGEEAMCDSNFLSNVSVGGEAQQTDDTHQIVTVTKIKVTLQLVITIWVPAGASQHVIAHEDGHRQISENYYQIADKLARQIAASYIGQHDLISGTDLPSEFNKLLKQMGADITTEYNKQLNPEPAQLRYDSITDHSRNDVDANDAVTQVLRDLPPTTVQAATSPIH